MQPFSPILQLYTRKLQPQHHFIIHLKNKKMKKSFETGYAKNVANFQQEISFTKGYGSSYNPSRPSLTIEGLEDALTTAQKAMATAKDAKVAFDNATNARQVAFKDLKPFCVQVLSSFIAAGVPALAIDDAKGILRKVQGRRAKKIVLPKVNETDNAEETAEQKMDRYISVSQLSYDNQLDHFSKLVETVLQQPLYTPNEEELSVTGLKNKLKELGTLNQSVIDTYTKWSNARIQRNYSQFDPVTGIVSIALDVKSYVKSIFGSTSQQYKQISGIKFRRV